MRTCGVAGLKPLIGRHKFVIARGTNFEEEGEKSKEFVCADVE
jgi:hypothetical protein